MFNSSHLSWMAGAATFATTFMFLLMGKLRRFMQGRMTRLAGVALMAPVVMLGLAPAATFAATVHPNEDAAARVTVTLAVDGPATLAPGSAFNYQITVRNDGPGAADSTRVDLPLDANVVIDDFASTTPDAFVQSLTADMVSVQFHDLGAGITTSATLMAHISADAPAALTLSSRATVNWSDKYLNRASASDGVTLLVGTGAPPAPTQPLTVAADGPVAAGTVLTFNGTFYTADEAIGMWLNTPDGITLPAESLGQTDSALSGTVVGLDAVGLADDAGMLTYYLDTTGLPSGTYSLVGHGLTSGIEGVAGFTIK